MNIFEEIKSGNKEIMKMVFDEYSLNAYYFAYEITGDHEKSLAAVRAAFKDIFSRIKRNEVPVNLRLSILRSVHEEAFNSLQESIKNEDNNQALFMPHILPEDKEESPLNESSLKKEDPMPLDVPAVRREKEKLSVAVIILIILNVIMFIVLVWFVIGFLETMDIIPRIDLGYSLFDRYIWPLFKIQLL